MSIKYKQLPEPELVYPVLRKRIDCNVESASGYVVLFVEPCCGMVIDQGGSAYPAGFYGQSWTPATCTNTWQPVEATISG